MAKRESPPPASQSKSIIQMANFRKATIGLARRLSSDARYVCFGVLHLTRVIELLLPQEINEKEQSKFYIDGFSVTKEKLLDFFQSVSLNIQNPHFLIMQGKIIKVISMKPTEVSSC